MAPWPKSPYACGLHVYHVVQLVRRVWSMPRGAGCCEWPRVRTNRGQNFSTWITTLCLLDCLNLFEQD